MVDSNVIDVGYSGVIGADRIVDGDELYGERFAPDNERGDTYGPVNYLFYVPFEQALTWSGAWDDLPAAHGAALAADLLVILGLLLLGRRLRPGAEGRTLGLALALRVGRLPVQRLRARVELQRRARGRWPWSALLALTTRPVRAAPPRAWPWPRRGRQVRPAGARAAVRDGGRASGARGTRWCSRLALVAALLAAPSCRSCPTAGCESSTTAPSATRPAAPSPFSIWGQEPSLDWLQTAVKGAAVGLALLVAFVPRRKTPGADWPRSARRC